MSDEMFYDINVLLPVTVRFWAATAREAEEQFGDTEISLTGPMHSFSTGFPEIVSVKEVEQADERGLTAID